MPSLAVNIDHIATLRQARLGVEPDPVAAALEAEAGGAVGIIAHLREDRRHVQDHDIHNLKKRIATQLNFEMAATDEMRQIALEVRPALVCLVPEKREELTTEGGLAVAGREKELAAYLTPLHDAGIESSLFIEASADQIAAARDVGSKYVELHTGHYADAEDDASARRELDKILEGIRLGRDMGLLVNLGHGLNYSNVLPFAQVPGVHEYSIGHSIISRAVFVGVRQAVQEMADTIRDFTV
jgi:pyridoxine 5-phosphate synthase